MFRYGKTTQYAISAASRLAELYDEDEKKLVSSLEIAESRNLPKPIIAKLLSQLSTAGLVSGSPGPRGGYRLAKHPSEVSLFDVAVLFERIDDKVACPFGPHWCGVQEPCPMHFELLRLNEEMINFLRNTTLDTFMPENIEKFKKEVPPGPPPTDRLGRKIQS